MPSTESKPLEFEWVGGELCLDFNNTVSWNRSGFTQERLETGDDLAAWGRRAGLPESTGNVSRKSALRDALGLRDTLHRLFSPLSRWHAPLSEDLARLNRYLSRALSRARISRGKGVFMWDFSVPGDLDPVLCAVAWSAGRLLASSELPSLRECANPECGWLFVDRSRRKNRRWCQMSECGNRSKARRYYRKHSISARSKGVRFPE